MKQPIINAVETYAISMTIYAASITALYLIYRKRVSIDERRFIEETGKKVGTLAQESKERERRLEAIEYATEKTLNEVHEAHINARPMTQDEVNISFDFHRISFLNEKEFEEGVE